MPDRRANALTHPRIESLLDAVESKFTLVTLSAKRARQINEYYNQLGEGLGRIVPPQVTSVSRKPLSIALEEIDASKIVAVAVDPEGEGVEGEPGADGEEAAPGLSLVADEGDGAAEGEAG